MEQLSFIQNPMHANNVARFGGQDASVPVARPAPVAGNVTEIIMAAGQVENFQLLLPMLTQLNQEKRWLAWIDPPQSLVSKWQKMRGIVAGELLVLRSTPEHPVGDLAERALRAGTCHAVVMWTGGRLGRQSMAALEKASASGNSHGVVLRQR